MAHVMQCASADELPQGSDGVFGHHTLRPVIASPAAQARTCLPIRTIMIILRAR